MKAFAARTDHLKQSDIRALTAVVKRVQGINLGQGICDMPVPDPIKQAAIEAIGADESVYTAYAGIDRLQESILHKAHTFNRIPATSPDEVMVSVGSTGAFVTAIFALLEPGDEVILFEPFYGYHLNLVKLTGATPRSVKTRSPDWSIDFDELEATITPRTKAVIVNTPSNPSGKVWSRSELETLIDLLHRYDLYAITDEIYEYMTYDGHAHISPASLPGAYERTITLSGFSKTYNMTGWRLGYAIAPPPLIEKMGLLNDLFYICAPTPLQHGVIAALEMPDTYFDDMLAAYTAKRQLICETLEAIGFTFSRPQGAYYVLADFSPLSETRSGFEDDRAASTTLVEQAGVAVIPGGSFFHDPEDGRHLLRFCYAKEPDVLEEACARLRTAFETIPEKTW